LSLSVILYHLFNSYNEIKIKVHFAAINCWHPGGECRLQYAKVPSWPVIMAYYQIGLGVQYRGTWTTPSIIRFIKSLLSPVKRLTSPDNLLQLMTGRDVYQR